MNNTQVFTGITAASGTSDVFDYSVAEFGNIESALSVTAVSWTAPTLDIDVEVSYDKLTWFTAASFTQATWVTKEILNVNKRAKFVRYSYTIWGTATPTFSFTIFTITKDA